MSSPPPGDVPFLVETALKAYPPSSIHWYPSPVGAEVLRRSQPPGQDLTSSHHLIASDRALIHHLSFEDPPFFSQWSHNTRATRRFFGCLLSSHLLSLLFNSFLIHKINLLRSNSSLLFSFPFLACGVPLSRPSSRGPDGSRSDKGPHIEARLAPRRNCHSLSSTATCVSRVAFLHKA
jgi:hypothetical protein